jgi:hypothetical protein
MQIKPLGNEGVSGFLWIWLIRPLRSNLEHNQNLTYTKQVFQKHTILLGKLLNAPTEYLFVIQNTLKSTKSTKFQVISELRDFILTYKICII